MTTNYRFGHSVHSGDAENGAFLGVLVTSNLVRCYGTLVLPVENTAQFVPSILMTSDKILIT